ncbi:hypothetical protein PPGU19_037190 [Paraburkholderia sp. PGU19]|nr:hypothetical protein PPGU19_037190 [Paraburkholderia sp. PGU19]
MAKGIDPPNRPAPAQLMFEKTRSRGFRAGMSDHESRDDHLFSCRAYCSPNRVILCKEIGKLTKAANRIQCFTTYRDCLPETRLGQTKRETRRDAGQELIVDGSR